jgi:NTP pyrophosphatase (non-canonical NTP hydrolase)
MEAVGRLVGTPPSAYIGHMHAYVSWTMQVWSTTDRAMSIQDLLVMTAGLAGEMGELLEQHAYVGTCKEDPRELQLEFGDVLYYWARIIHHFGVDIDRVINLPKDASFLPAGPARLPISISVVSEAIKKFVRNDHRRLTESRSLALTEGLGLVWQDWSAMADFHGLELIEVIAANHAKLRQRHARQVAKRDRAIAHAETALASLKPVEDDAESIPFTGAMSG